MISRLSAFAALFAVLAACLAVLSTANDATAASSGSLQLEPSATPMKVYDLQRVVITGKRVASANEAR